MRTMSSAKDAASDGSTMALPPYFTTIDPAAEALDVRQRLDEHVGPLRSAAASRVAAARHDVPMFSSM